MSSPFERGVFTLSLDFELAWGSRDLLQDPAPLLALARVTREQVFQPLLDLLVSHGMVATWATVGHLFLGSARRVGGTLHPEVVPPSHPWRRAPWFEGVPDGTEAEHPEFYARSLVERLCRAGQEVGSHGFSHAIFGDLGCSRQTADTELDRAVAAARELGISLRAFVFPRNRPGHLDLLANHGFTCWRGPEPSRLPRAGLPAPLRRAAHLARVASAATPLTVLPQRGDHGLWELPASTSWLPLDGVRRAVSLAQRVRRCVRGLDAAAGHRRVFHLWLHPINLATEPRRQLAALGQVVEHAARLRDTGRIDVLPMTALARAAREAS